MNLKEKKSENSNFQTWKETGLSFLPLDTVTKMFTKKLKKKKKPEQSFLSYKKFKEESASKRQFFKEKRLREKNHMEEIMGKLSIDPKELQNAIPMSLTYETFARLNKIYSKMKSLRSTKKTIGMGIGERIPLSDKEKWIKKVELYNSHSEQRIDPKLDNTPGPAAYSIVSHWAGKKPHKEKAQSTDRKLNFFKATSSGPHISPYYSKNL